MKKKLLLSVLAISSTTPALVIPLGEETAVAQTTSTGFKDISKN